MLSAKEDVLVWLALGTASWPIPVLWYCICSVSSAVWCPLSSTQHLISFPLFGIMSCLMTFFPLLSFKFLHPLLVSKRKPSLTECLVLWWERLAGTSASHTRKHSWAWSSPRRRDSRCWHRVLQWLTVIVLWSRFPKVQCQIRAMSLVHPLHSL